MAKDLEEYLISIGAITQEQLDRKVEEARNSSLPIRVNEDLGNALVVTFQNDNMLGDMIMNLMMMNNDLANMVVNLQLEVEALKNA